MVRSVTGRRLKRYSSVLIASHWGTIPVLLEPGEGLFVQGFYDDVGNEGESAGEAYVNLKVIRPRTGLPDSTLVNTLPGADSYNSDEAFPGQWVKNTNSPVSTIQPGATGRPLFADATLKRIATPPDVLLKVEMSLYHVINEDAQAPEDVGVIGRDGFHSQQDAIFVSTVGIPELFSGSEPLLVARRIME